MMNVGYGPNYRDPMCAHPNAKLSVVDGSLQTPCVKARGEDGATDKSVCWPDAKLFEQAPQPEPQPEMQPYVIAETVVEKSAWERIKHWFI
jgi:hypothetical protein